MLSESPISRLSFGIAACLLNENTDNESMIICGDEKQMDKNIRYESKEKLCKCLSFY